MALSNGHTNGAVEEEITVYELELEDDGSPTKERSVGGMPWCRHAEPYLIAPPFSTSVCRRQSSPITCACRSRLGRSLQKLEFCTPTSRSMDLHSNARNSTRRCAWLLSVCEMPSYADCLLVPGTQHSLHDIPWASLCELDHLPSST